MPEHCNKSNNLSDQKWNDNDDANNEYLEDNFTEQIDYKLSTVHSKDLLQMYKSKAMYSIHYLICLKHPCEEYSKMDLCKLKMHFSNLSQVAKNRNLNKTNLWQFLF